MKFLIAFSMFYSLSSFSGQKIANPKAVSADSIKIHNNWGSLKELKSIEKRIFIAGQPDYQGFVRAKTEGITAVIDMRRPGELAAFNEAEVVRNLGMKYYNVPVGGTNFRIKDLRKVGKIVKNHSPDKVLVHCGSGNRVAAWLVQHLVYDHVQPLDQSVEIAQKIYLTSSRVEDHVREIIKDDLKKK